MKSILKKEILETRNSLSDLEIQEKSSHILKKLSSLSEFQNAKTVMFYVSTHHEVDIIEFIKSILKSDKTIVVPVVDNEKKEIIASELKDFSHLESKTFKILEPKTEFIKKINPKEINLVLVPGIVFDKKGHRIGYGHGYYDQFLKKTNAIAIGLAYDFQIVDEVPHEDHDVPMDIVVTEKRVVRVTKK